MTMDRKRFGAGILGGLLLGLLIVGASVPSLSGTFESLVPAAAVVSSSTEASSPTATVLSTSAASTTFTSSSSVVYTVAPGGNTSGIVYSVSTSMTSASHSISSVTTSTQPVVQSSSGNAANSVAGGAVFGRVSASRLDNIASQPLVVNGLVLLPIIVAIGLGALFYRVSGNAKGRSQREPAAD